MPAKKGYGMKKMGGMKRANMGTKKMGGMGMKGTKTVMGNKTTFGANPSVSGGKMKKM